MFHSSKLLKNVPKYTFIGTNKHTYTANIDCRSSKYLNNKYYVTSLNNKNQLNIFKNTRNFGYNNSSSEFGYFGLRMNTPSDLLKLATDAVKYSEKSVENLVDYYNNCKNSGDSTENISKKALYVIDDISNTLCSIADPSEFLRHVHENDEWRKVANECIEIISDFIGKININKKIYEILINDKNDLNKDEELVLSHMIESMKSQGVHLSQMPQIEYLKLLKEELMLSYSIFELSSKNQHPYNQILKNAENPEFRKQVWLSQRKSNQESLLKILELRDTRTKLSQIRGFPDYREYSQKECMLNKDIEKFLINCSNSIKDQLYSDLNELSNLNSKIVHKSASSLNPWDIDYLINLKRNENIIFLSLKTLIDFFKYLVNELFNIELMEDDIKQESLWDDKIIKYNLVHDNRTVANLYLDLFERDSKTTMCAQFTIRCSKTYSKVDKDGDKYINKIMNPLNYEENEDKLIQIPSTVVTTSFTSRDKVKGIEFKDIKIDLHNCEIIFHELGHTLHTLLSRTELQHLSGNRGPIDFAEFSSHLFELFFQNHVVEMMKLEGINEIFNEKDVMYYKKFESVELARMIISSQIDQRFYDDKYKDDWIEIENGLDYKDIFKNYENYFNEKYEKWKNDEDKWNGNETIVTLLGPIAITNFDHLIHYGGNYYCYLYSRILAIKAYKSFENKSYKEIGNRLLEFFKKGSIDSSISPINKLAGKDLNEEENTLFYK
ncbi:mitochondrial intermediate peptidase [Theileria orientalis]|uniref:Mitochondrial intermediate peptidase n=1 Tax=Theileria orientalis TaxID=68886 RepID=A0A976SIE3_THEOR|nr:mitochondrial intermediate peptidase [Theileria orientalis]